MSTLEEIAARAAAATPGPWHTQFTVDRDPEEYAAECVRLSLEWAEDNGLPAPTTIHMTYAGDWFDDETPGGIITAMTGNGPTSEANAAFIAHARTDIPFLLARVMDTRVILEEVLADAESQHPGGWGPDVTTVGRLREALALLGMGAAK